MPQKKYPNHTIGEHTVPFQLIFTKEQTVDEVLKLIEKRVGSWPNSESIFIVDGNNTLVGAVEFKVLINSEKEKTMSELVVRNVHSLTDHSHQNTAVKLAIKKGVESIPVTDRDGKFIGIVDSGQILKIMHEEHIEKLMHFSGILDNESLVEGYTARINHVVFSRLPWLMLGLLGGLLSTYIIKSFSVALETQLELAFFIPVIVYMNAAVGNQAQTIFVRYSSLEKVHLIKSLIFEIKISLLIGISLALMIYLFSFFLVGPLIAGIVSFSMFAGIMSSAFISTIVPWIFDKAGKDPAIGSGPFTTILQDLLSIVIYFSIATALI